jgi:hypothetical protein
MSGSAWPTIGTNGYAIDGYATIKFGTDGILPISGISGGSGGITTGSTTGSATYVIESIRAEDERDVQYIMQGTGFKATRITLYQGRKYVVTLVDDTGIPTITVSTKVTINDPISNAGGGSYGTVSYAAKVIGQNGVYSRKVEGKRELTLEILTLIEGGGTTQTAGSAPA